MSGTNNCITKIGKLSPLPSWRKITISPFKGGVSRRRKGKRKQAWLTTGRSEREWLLLVGASGVKFRTDLGRSEWEWVICGSSVKSFGRWSAWRP